MAAVELHAKGRRVRVRESRLENLGLLAVRLIPGLLVAGHGAQKLFGAFGGPGLEKWTSATESMGLHPPRLWALLGASSEFGGGLLTAAGALSPLGPIVVASSMISASLKGHWGKPIWGSKGGPELAVSFLSSAAVAGTVGPGAYSVDRLLALRVPRWMTRLTLLGSALVLTEAIRPTIAPILFAPDLGRDNGETEG